jgi:endonuclease III
MDITDMTITATATMDTVIMAITAITAITERTGKERTSPMTAHTSFFENVVRYVDRAAALTRHPPGLIEHIKTIGLFRNKAKNVIKLCQMLIDDYGGQVPSSRAALQRLPGVGRKTANVVLNMWFHYPAQAVDTHILRIGNRTGIAVGRDELAIERAIEDHVPAEYQQHAHHWLILHGRYICVARKPKCGICPIRDDCQFEDKTA